MSTLRIVRPDFVTEEHLEYLDELRESGDTNVFGAASYLYAQGFPDIYTLKQARSVVTYWMATFEQRHLGG